MCQVMDILNDKGEVVGCAFQCGGHRLPNGELESMEERWWRMEAESQMALSFEEMIREATPLHDPNRCDTRNVRKELGDKMINLGLRVNKIVAGRSRRWQ